MRDVLKLFLKYIMRFLLHIYWIFPIHNKKIFFMSTMGKSYSCNPKYLYESMIQDPKFKNSKFIWAFIKPEKWKENFKDYNNTKLIKKKNYISFFYHLLTAKVIIYNCGGFSYAPIRKKQLLIETWHGGGGFKSVGVAIKGKSNASKKGIEIACNEIKLFLSPAEVTTEKLIKEGFNYKGTVLNSGLPRNDILFHNSKEKCKEIKSKLNIDENAKIILYAPTFKGLEHKAVNINNKFEVINPYLVKEALHNKYGGNWLFFTRGHQYANEINLEGADRDLSDYPDMQELLLISDVLITDYSSSIWDFAFTKKMCILFAPDIKNFEKNERSLCTPFMTWPGIPTFSNDDIIKEIESFDESEYLKKVENYIINLGNYESGIACEKVKEYILKELEK